MTHVHETIQSGHSSQEWVRPRFLNAQQAMVFSLDQLLDEAAQHGVDVRITARAMPSRKVHCIEVRGDIDWEMDVYWYTCDNEACQEGLLDPLPEPRWMF